MMQSTAELGKDVLALVKAERRLMRACLMRCRKAAVGTGSLTDLTALKQARQNEEDFIRYYGTQRAVGSSIEYSALNALEVVLQQATAPPAHEGPPLRRA